MTAGRKETPQQRRIELALLIADRLARTYDRSAAELAAVCDDRADRSGNLLGWLREYIGFGTAR